MPYLPIFLFAAISAGAMFAWHLPWLSSRLFSS